MDIVNFLGTIAMLVVGALVICNSDDNVDVSWGVLMVVIGLILVSLNSYIKHEQEQDLLYYKHVVGIELTPDEASRAVKSQYYDGSEITVKSKSKKGR
ncbi:MAG: hypothetical protein PF440_04280 [Thiomicrorhabdus sp.]|jgi:hypothetical protein|nr:hypothetical protein [Thiomicrorhabdus sp.]